MADVLDRLFPVHPAWTADHDREWLEDGLETWWDLRPRWGRDREAGNGWTCIMWTIPCPRQHHSLIELYAYDPKELEGDP